MPIRQFPIITGKFYHVFNRGINRQPIFTTDTAYHRAKFTLNYYQFTNPPKLSYLLDRPKDVRQKILNDLSATPTKIEILAFCLMPNHFHLVLRQTQDYGISKFLADFQNSYTKYFNAKNKRSGSLLNRQFKSVNIETGFQLSHIIRYAILNPFSSSIVKSPEIALSYPYSQINYETIKKHLDINKVQLEEFILNHADYQKQLEKIKHLTLEKQEFES